MIAECSIRVAYANPTRDQFHSATPSKRERLTHMVLGKGKPHRVEERAGCLNHGINSRVIIALTNVPNIGRVLQQFFAFRASLVLHQRGQNNRQSAGVICVV
jgi:hypothetical protein